MFDVYMMPGKSCDGPLVVQLRDSFLCRTHFLPIACHLQTCEVDEGALTH